MKKAIAAAATLFVTSAGWAGNVLTVKHGAFTSIEPNPVNGSLSNPYLLTSADLGPESTGLFFFTNISSNPFASGSVTFMGGDLSSSIFFEYRTDLRSRNYGFDATNFDSRTFIDGTAQLANGVVTDVSLRALDANSLLFPFTSPLITVSDNHFVVGYDPTFAPNYGGATLRGVILDTYEYRYVPEPATWAMLIVGFSLIGATARRQTASPARTRLSAIP